MRVSRLEIELPWNNLTHDRPAAVTVDAAGITIRPKGCRKPKMWLPWTRLVEHFALRGVDLDRVSDAKPE